MLFLFPILDPHRYYRTHKLKYLKIVNTITVDKNFDPLLQLRELETFNSSWNYPKKEFEKLKELPLLKNSNVSSCLK
jgi:hypothetical protein